MGPHHTKLFLVKYFWSKNYSKYIGKCWRNSKKLKIALYDQILIGISYSYCCWIIQNAVNFLVKFGQKIMQDKRKFRRNENSEFSKPRMFIAHSFCPTLPLTTLARSNSSRPWRHKPHGLAAILKLLVPCRSGWPTFSLFPAFDWPKISACSGVHTLPFANWAKAPAS